MRRLVVMFLLVVGLGAFWYFHDLRGVEEERRVGPARLPPI